MDMRPRPMPPLLPRLLSFPSFLSLLPFPLLLCWPPAGMVVSSTGIRVTTLEVPDHVTLGDEVVMKCAWDLTSHQLYSVRWYRDGQEFYRYLPSEDPPSATLPLRGVHVNESASSGGQVVLTRADLDTTGRYKCEVISDWPEFHTADRGAFLLVVEVPEAGPIIVGPRVSWHPGDRASLTCEAPPSLPPATLTWYINDKKAPLEYVIDLGGTKLASGLEKSRQGLEFTVRRSHFKDGSLTLRCAAKISTLYYKTHQHTLDRHGGRGVGSSYDDAPSYSYYQPHNDYDQRPTNDLHTNELTSLDLDDDAVYVGDGDAYGARGRKYGVTRGHTYGNEDYFPHSVPVLESRDMAYTGVASQRGPSLVLLTVVLGLVVQLHR